MLVFTSILLYRDDDAVVFVMVVVLWLVGIAPKGASRDSSSTSITPKEVTKKYTKSREPVL